MSVVAGLPRGPLALPADPFLGRRRGETWVVDVLDGDDRTLEPLTGVESGQLDYSIHTEIRSSGSITVSDPGRVDWHRVRLSVRYEFTDEAGALHSHPLGVFLPTTPTAHHGQDGSTAEVEVYDKMVLLSADAVASTWTADVGTSVVQAVTDVLATIGEDGRVVGPDDGGGVLRSAMVWEPGTPKLRIVNDILEAGNFFSIWVDGEGVWQLRPYIAPTARGVEWEHMAGFHAIFAPNVTHEADSFHVPNRVVLVGRAEDEETPAPYAVAENNNPADPYSIPGRGRVIAVREDEQDATSETVLGQLAARRLLDLSSATSTFQLQHAWVPVDLNGAVRLRWAARGIDVLTVLQKWSWSWSADSVPDLVGASLREVRE